MVDQKQKFFDEIIKRIATKGKKVDDAIKGIMSIQEFKTMHKIEGNKEIYLEALKEKRRYNIQLKKDLLIKPVTEGEEMECNDRPLRWFCY